MNALCLCSCIPVVSVSFVHVISSFEMVENVSEYYFEQIRKKKPIYICLDLRETVDARIIFI